MTSTTERRQLRLDVASLGLTPRLALLLTAGSLLAIGLVMVASASMGVADAQFGNPFYFFLRHLIYLALGMVGAVIVYQLPMAFWQRHSWLVFGIGIALLVLVLIPGVGRRVNGSSRWIGLPGLTVQPSELVKLATMMFMAAYLVRRGDEVRGSWKGAIKPLVVIGLAIVLLLAEPDFGASVVIIAAAVGMLWMGGAPVGRFAALILAVVGLGALLIVFEPYRMRRLTAFLDPWQDQFDSGYQLVQSLIAFGRGEWFGVGLGNSVQKLFYLPEAHTDFVFAVFAEEFGLFGVLIVFTLIYGLVYAALTIGRRAVEAGQLFGGYLAYGIAFLIGVQSLINVSVNVGLFPTKGLTLPLISFGGTSLIIACAMLAILLRVDGETALAATSSRRPERVR